MTTLNLGIEQILKDITTRLMEDAVTGRLYSVVVDIALQATSAEACSLYLEEIDDKGSDEIPERIALVAGAGFEKYRINKASYTKGEGLTGTIWKSGEWIKCDTRDDIEDPKKGWIGKFNELVRNDIPNWESTSLIGGPLIAGGRTIGVLKLENKDPAIGKHFTDDDFNLLKLIAGVISLAIQNRRNLEQSYSKIFRAIIDVSEMILGDQVIPVSILRQKILNKCLSIFNAEASSLYLEEISDINQHVPTLKMVAGEGYEKNRVGIAKYNKGEGLTGRIWRDGKSVKYDSQQEIEDESSGWLGKFNKVVKASQKDWICSSLMGVPLKIGERTMGVLKVENKKPSPEAHFTFDELRSLEILASFIAFSLEMLRSHSELFYKGESARSIIHGLHNIVRSSEYHALRVKETCNKSPGCRLAVQDSIDKMLSNIGEISNSFKRHDQITDAKKEVVCFNNLISRNVTLFQAIAKDNHFEFEFDGGKELIYVNVIEDYIYRAIRNILSNSIDALSGVENPKILVKTCITQEESLQKLTVIINDSGPGLDEGQVCSFREKRAIRSSKHSWQGSGLPESQGLLKANEVSFEYLERGHDRNSLGGACFELVFLTCKPSKVKILVIDNDVAVLECFETHFRNQELSNIQIDTSISHTAFIDIIKSNVDYSTHPALRKYDWIFLDYSLRSDIDGNSLLQIIKKNDPVFAGKILLMSVYTNYVSQNPELRVYSKFDEILNESLRNKIESNLLCGLRP
jgi:transcriptional regulator with GAF, ATPase, and Fis domain